MTTKSNILSNQEISKFLKLSSTKNLSICLCPSRLTLICHFCPNRQICLLAAETSVSSLSTIPLNHGSRVVKSLKQNRAKSRIAWNNVVPANVHEEDWPPSIVMGAWLQSTLHTGPAPCLYQYLSFACTQAHGAWVLCALPRRTDACRARVHRKRWISSRTGI